MNKDNKLKEENCIVHSIFIPPPPTFETQDSLLTQFSKHASPFHIFENIMEDANVMEELEGEDDDDEEEEVESTKPKMSFMDRLKLIQKDETKKKEPNSFNDEKEVDIEEDFIPVNLPNLSIYSPFAKDPDPKKTPAATILHKEIESLVRFIDETPQEREARNKIIKKFTEFIQRKYPGSSVCVYGSFRSHLMIPGSDLDLQVTMRNPGNNSKAADKSLTRKILFNLHGAMLNKNMIRQGSKVIVAARVPVIQCHEYRTGQPIDISINFSQTSHIIFSEINIAERNADLILNFCRICPAYRQLVLLLKLFIRQRCMNNVHFGGLSSFGLCLLLMSFFQHHDLINGTKKDRKKLSLGVLLIDFFGLFGIHFNYMDVAIDVSGDGKFFKKRTIQGLEERDRMGNNKLYILNPNERNHIVTSGTTKMDLIRRVFNESFHKLTSPKENFPYGNRILPRILRIEEDLLRRGKFVKAREFQNRNKTSNMY